ncbi:MAG: tetratricopeptide repeat protein [Candidatus Hydrogenedentes bacterium]|nr:tetratricopeptide repeat protein [Candidatus Hydrogenedentota bacterium]
MKEGMCRFAIASIVVGVVLLVMLKFILPSNIWDGMFGFSHTRYNDLIREALEAISIDPRLTYPDTKSKVRRAFVLIEEKGFPTTPEEEFIMSMQYYREGEVERAIALLSDIIKNYPDFCDAYAYLAYITYSEERNDNSLIIGLFEKAIGCNPNKSLYYTWLGSFYKNNLMWRDGEGYNEEYKIKAEECYKKAISLNEEDISAWNNYGNFLVDIKNYEEAEKVYKKAIEIFPEHGKPQYNLAALMAIKGDYESAIKWLKEALKYNPELRREAKIDKDFDILRGDPRFEELISNRLREEILYIHSED